MFDNLTLVPPDPLLGIIERFRSDTKPEKIDLGVGVYKDDDNQTPVLASVKLAERQLLQSQMSKTYLGPLGDQVFTRKLNELVLGPELKLVDEGRIAALQTPGGCGALRTAAELIKRANSGAKIWVSDPTWANHVPLLGDAGIAIATYPYYDFTSKTLRFDDMMAAVAHIPRGDILLLHGCCHNPCGADLSIAQWCALSDLIVEKGVVPFIDMAYQGLGEGLDEDAYGLRLLLSRAPEAVYAVSCSKNFGLYRDRVGLVGFLAENAPKAKIILTNLAQIVRGIYSMPPDHGAAVVATILQSDTLTQQWRQELAEMRTRIQRMRSELAHSMHARGFDTRFDFVQSERGMFSFLGITPAEVDAMAQQFGVYMAGSSRINVAGLNATNMPYFADALATVLRAR